MPPAPDSEGGNKKFHLRLKEPQRAVDQSAIEGSEAEGGGGQ